MPTTRPDNGWLVGRLWRTSLPVDGSPVESYFRQARGLRGPIPTDIRFAELWHRESNRIIPAVVAAVRQWGERSPSALHRTFIKPDGSGKADVNPNRKMLGHIGGGGVWLGTPTEELVVAEGIESALSVQEGSGLPTVAALSASGIRQLLLPPVPLATTVYIAADGDDVGIVASLEAAARWTAEGRTVRIKPAPPGRDFNDLIREVTE